MSYHWAVNKQGFIYTYVYTYVMATKTLTITEDAYNRLASLKSQSESFSETIKRVLPKIDLRNFHGIISQEMGNEMLDLIKNNRKNQLKLQEEKLKKIIGSFD